MRTLTTFANGKSLILLVLFLGYFGCTPEVIKPNPTPDPTPSKPKITVFSVSPSSRNLVYDGSVNPQTTVTIDFGVTGATGTATVNGIPVANGIFTSAPIFSGQKFVIQASNAQGTSSEAVDIAVTVDPTMQLLTSSRFVPVKLVAGGVYFPNSITYDDTISFSLDSKVKVDNGTVSPGGGTWPISLSSDKKFISGWYVSPVEILKLTSDSLVYKVLTQNTPPQENITHLKRVPW